MLTNNIFIAGHNGMVGSAILKKLKDENPKHWNFYNNPKLDVDVFAFDELSDEEKKQISN